MVGKRSARKTPDSRTVKPKTGVCHVNAGLDDSSVTKRDERASARRGRTRAKLLSTTLVLASPKTKRGRRGNDKNTPACKSQASKSKKQSNKCGVKEVINDEYLSDDAGTETVQDDAVMQDRVDADSIGSQRVDKHDVETDDTDVDSVELCTITERKLRLFLSEKSSVDASCKPTAGQYTTVTNDFQEQVYTRQINENCEKIKDHQVPENDNKHSRSSNKIHSIIHGSQDNQVKTGSGKATNGPMNYTLSIPESRIDILQKKQTSIVVGKGELDWLLNLDKIPLKSSSKPAVKKDMLSNTIAEKPKDPIKTPNATLPISTEHAKIKTDGKANNGVKMQLTSDQATAGVKRGKRVNCKKQAKKLKPEEGENMVLTENDDLQTLILNRNNAMTNSKKHDAMYASDSFEPLELSSKIPAKRFELDGTTKKQNHSGKLKDKLKISTKADKDKTNVVTASSVLDRNFDMSRTSDGRKEGQEDGTKQKTYFSDSGEASSDGEGEIVDDSEVKVQHRGEKAGNCGVIKVDNDADDNDVDIDREDSDTAAKQDTDQVLYADRTPVKSPVKFGDRRSVVKVTSHRFISASAMEFRKRMLLGKVVRESGKQRRLNNIKDAVRLNRI